MFQFRRSTSTRLVAVFQSKTAERHDLPAHDVSSCQPISHIYYLKTHKTGSSTIGTMILKYGIIRNRTIVLDPDLADMQWPAPLELNEVSSLVNKDSAKIFSSHIRFNKGPVNTIFPKPKAKYITILRNPLDRFKSAWLFYGYTRRTGVSSAEGPLNKFLRSPNALEEIRKRLSNTNVYRIYNHISNSNLFDMGLEQENLQNMALVKRYIDKMEEEFDLVMIADYFDESLILLKRLLCWEFEDIVYVKLRAKKKKLEFEEEVKRNILIWNRADATLFDHFNKTFWRKVQQEGPSFYEDLKVFRKINHDYQAMCQSIEYQNKKCKLSKTPPCNILEQLWRSRGNTFSGHGCGPIPSDIAKYRRLKST